MRSSTRRIFLKDRNSVRAALFVNQALPNMTKKDCDLHSAPWMMKFIYSSTKSVGVEAMLFLCVIATCILYSMTTRAATGPTTIAFFSKKECSVGKSSWINRIHLSLLACFFLECSSGFRGPSDGNFRKISKWSMPKHHWFQMMN